MSFGLHRLVWEQKTPQLPPLTQARCSLKNHTTPQAWTHTHTHTHTHTDIQTPGRQQVYLRSDTYIPPTRELKSDTHRETDMVYRLTSSLSTHSTLDGQLQK